VAISVSVAWRLQPLLLSSTNALIVGLWGTINRHPIALQVVAATGVADVPLD
jgi:hypothetical protein